MKVSIIMPCYNVGSTLFRALDSVLMQKVNFDYEILVIDDASTDNTLEIAKSYMQLDKRIKLICNEKNRGNAYSYYRGLCASRGDYFCVLDGDDYYTIPDKLQRQVDFLDSDLNEEYVGTATYFVIDLGNNFVSVPDRNVYQEFSYADMLTQHSGYYHTATYMYRNIFRGNVPTQVGDVLYRGDTPRTTFHLMYSGKKIKILDFVGSAYTFEFGGVWSSLKQKQQFEYQINYQIKHRENVTTDFERAAADNLIQINKKKMEEAQDDLRRYPAVTIDHALMYAGEYAAKFAFAQKDFVLQHAYYSSYIDTLCASLGYIDRVRNVGHIQRKVNTENICIVNGVLNPRGGGIFAEIDELIGIYSNKKVYLFVTNMKEVPLEAKCIFEKHSNLTIICPPKGMEERLGWFQEKMVEIAPYRCYYYCSHRDTYGVALPQSGVCENVALFSFDHGYLCGISNPYIDTIVAKRPVDYWMLRRRFGEKVLFIPTWNDGATGCEDYSYTPFFEHDALITASGAARFYKVDGRPPYRYIDLIVALLKNTGGIHYHFGELSEEVLDEIHHKLEKAGVSLESFIHISWADNIPLELLKNHVDVFIEPFPVVSYKLTLEVLSVGIPIIVHKGITRMSIADFVPKETLVWRDQKEFIELLIKVDSKFLRMASKNAMAYFNNYHRTECVSELLYANKGIEVSEYISYPDNTLMDISASFRLFGKDFRVSIMNSATEHQKKEKLERDQKEKEKLEKRDCEKIRASRSFKIGFLITFPLRVVKQFCLKVFSKGPVQGVRELMNPQLLFYYRDTPNDELKTLQNSAAFKVGEKIVVPYHCLRYGLKEKNDMEK